MIRSPHEFGNANYRIFGSAFRAVTASQPLTSLARLPRGILALRMIVHSARSLVQIEPRTETLVNTSRIREIFAPGGGAPSSQSHPWGGFGHSAVARLVCLSWSLTRAA